MTLTVVSSNGHILLPLSFVATSTTFFSSYYAIFSLLFYLYQNKVNWTPKSGWCDHAIAFSFFFFFCHLLPPPLPLNSTVLKWTTKDQKLLSARLVMLTFKMCWNENENLTKWLKMKIIRTTKMTNIKKGIYVYRVILTIVHCNYC